MEEYKGVKFRFELRDEDMPEEKVQLYLQLDKSLAKHIIPGKNEGNMSMRIPEGFLIKRAGAQMTELEPDDVLLIESVDGGIVHAVGKRPPSSETRMHNEIYRRTDAKVILHFHDDELLARIEGESVDELPYGTQELAEAVGKAAERNKIVILRGHGIVIHAKDRNELLSTLEGLLWAEKKA